jgi:primosomal protein N' (replication factor Y)
MIAEVLVDIAHQAVDQVFDYEIPDALKKNIAIGQRVKVPFAGRKLTGFIVHIKQESDLKKVKPIESIVDVIPYFNHERLSLAKTLSFYHAYPQVAYLNAMVPSALKMRYETIYKVHDEKAIDEALRPFIKNGGINKKTLEQQFMPLLKEALEKNALEETLKVSNKARIKTVDYILLSDAKDVKGPKQRAIVEVLENHGGAFEKHALLKKANTTSQPLRALIKKDYVKSVSKERYREIKSLYELKDTPITLNDEQQIAKDTVKDALKTYHLFLLHGVTSSGKTEIYIKLVKDVLAQNKSAIILLPEISLTPKITARFKSVFDKEVAVLHSRLSLNEHYDEWRRIIRDEAHVVIGARSAIFAPLKDIGIIIIDEEHSDTYVQRDTPRYNALHVAKLRAQYHQAPLLQGSATPSVESMYEAKMGDMSYLSLTKRALKSKLPLIRLVDMKEAFLKGNTSIFSKELKQGIEKRLKKGEQTLLLINRRGHSQFVLCRSCGKAMRCKQCGISLTYHKENNQLMCHHCGHKEPMVKTCPNCGSRYIRYMGLGSQQVEEAALKTFSGATINRLDKDSSSRKNAHEEILYDFEENGDILVGTQMISKGLDFEKVTLVGVLSADMSFHVPDFFAESETFALLTQIAGRAGRRTVRGEVIIQAYDIDHPVLEDVVHGDYENFYKREITYRQSVGVPPFQIITQITIGHPNYNEAYKQALKIIRELKNALRYKILGPIKPTIYKTKDKAFVQILIKHDGKAVLYEHLNTVMRFVNLRTYQIAIEHNPRTM